MKAGRKLVSEIRADARARVDHELRRVETRIWLDVEHPDPDEIKEFLAESRAEAYRDIEDMLDRLIRFVYGDHALNRLEPGGLSHPDPGYPDDTIH